MNNFSNATRKCRWDWDEIVDSIFSYPSYCPQSPLSPVNKNDSRKKRWNNGSDGKKRRQRTQYLCMCCCHSIWIFLFLKLNEANGIESAMKKKNVCLFPLMEDTQRREFSCFITWMLLKCLKSISRWYRSFAAQRYISWTCIATASQMKRKKMGNPKTCWDDSPLHDLTLRMLFKLLCVRINFQVSSFSSSCHRTGLKCNRK